jgi:class 3 adenylate cyclase
MSGPERSARSGAILFTDLVGFTAYTDTHGDHAAVDVLDRQSSLVAAAIDGAGRVVKELGDGVMVWFDDPGAGLSATQTILGSVTEARDAAEFPLAVRMGMHVGEVIERGDDIVGQAVNIAARVADLAGPGELLVTDHVVRLLGDSARAAAFRPVGPTRVKGVAKPIWLHRLTT